MHPYRYVAGSTPLLVSVPHAGTFVPDEIVAGLTEPAKQLPDTDWHADRLYDFATDLGASLLLATHSRYVVDLNRAPDDRPLYPGNRNTSLCPTELFDGTPIYIDGRAPGKGEVAERMQRVWHPYHRRLADTLRENVERYGFALLYEAHTIRSQVPGLFEGRLPDLNLGTADGASVGSSLEGLLMEHCQSAEGYTSVLNGRFKGGYITRHYGRPQEGRHAVQLELSQRTYMEEAPPFRFDPERAGHVRPLLRDLLKEMLDWTPATRGQG